MRVTLNSKTDKPMALISGSNWNMECWFLWREENRRTPEKNPRSKDENQQQTQPTCDAGSGNRTGATAVGGKRSHHCAIPAPLQYLQYWPFQIHIDDVNDMYILSNFSSCFLQKWYKYIIVPVVVQSLYNYCCEKLFLFLT